MNAPSRFELFVLSPGESKLTITEDTKTPYSITLTLHKEDHTLANLLRSQLLLHPATRFCGYQVPHPLEPLVVIKLQTDGSLTPVLAVQEACSALIRTLVRMKREFGMAVERKEMEGEGEGAYYELGGGGGEGTGEGRAAYGEAQGMGEGAFAY